VFILYSKIQLIDEVVLPAPVSVTRKRRSDMLNKQGLAKKMVMKLETFIHINQKVTEPSGTYIHYSSLYK